tara:strand:- start:766 stop:1122 length:357 start_codon:yes stop_codon:yes gene_type:complete
MNHKSKIWTRKLFIEKDVEYADYSIPNILKNKDFFDLLYIDYDSLYVTCNKDVCIKNKINFWSDELKIKNILILHILYISCINNKINVNMKHLQSSKVFNLICILKNTLNFLRNSYEK